VAVARPKRKMVQMQTHEARAALVNGNFDLPAAVFKEAMPEVRAIVARAAADMLVALKKHKTDQGRVTAALDTLQHAKDIACVALILPWALEEVDDSDPRPAVEPPTKNA